MAGGRETVPRGGAPAAERRLQRAVLMRLRRWGAALPPDLSAAWRRLAARLRLFEPERLGPDGDGGYFLHPMALPVLQLPAWVAGEAMPAVGRAAAFGAALGYLHVRVIDDLLDEGIGGDRPGMLLAHLALVEHVAILARLARGNRRFDALLRRLWAAHLEGVAAEGRLPDAHRAQSRLLLAPAAAVLARRRCWTSWPELERFVDAVVEAHQAVNDLVDLARDRAAGRRSAILRRFGVTGSGAADALFGRGGLDALHAAIQERFRDAADAAGKLGLAGARDWVARRQAHAGSLVRAAWQAWFAALLDGAPAP